jgi:hypothetical protein
VTHRNRAVIGVYPSTNEADRAVYELLTRLSLIVEVSLLPAGAGAILRHPWMEAAIARGAAMGSIVGSVVGATLAGLASAGVISIRLFAVFLAAGPVVATVTGVVAGAVIGGFLGSIVSGSLAETGPRLSAADASAVAVSVHCGSSEDVQRAIAVLEQTGAADITEQPESVETGSAGPAGPNDETGIFRRVS